MNGGDEKEVPAIFASLVGERATSPKKVDFSPRIRRSLISMMPPAPDIPPTSDEIPSSQSRSPIVWIKNTSNCRDFRLEGLTLSDVSGIAGNQIAGYKVGLVRTSIQAVEQSPDCHRYKILSSKLVMDMTVTKEPNGVRVQMAASWVHEVLIILLGVFSFATVIIPILAAVVFIVRRKIVSRILDHWVQAFTGGGK